VNRIPLTSILTDRGREYCGVPGDHLYELYLDAESITHIKSQSKDPQDNQICATFHRIVLEDFYDFAFRRGTYRNLTALQSDLDAWIDNFNAQGVIPPLRRHQLRRLWSQTIKRATAQPDTASSKASSARDRSQEKAR
jgi:hypothetical protein